MSAYRQSLVWLLRLLATWAVVLAASSIATAMGFWSTLHGAGVNEPLPIAGLSRSAGGYFAIALVIFALAEILAILNRRSAQ